ncbi:hypothetical protein HKX48_001101 [Thoreauomyces humboldtii]|nr:hypothetical protein HKX48_001101 [Thoreauomyces humboldtii]
MFMIVGGFVGFVLVCGIATWIYNRFYKKETEEDYYGMNLKRITGTFSRTFRRGGGGGTGAAVGPYNSFKDQPHGGNGDIPKYAEFATVGRSDGPGFVEAPMYRQQPYSMAPPNNVNNGPQARPFPTNAPMHNHPMSGPPPPGVVRAPTYNHPVSGPPSPGMMRSQTYNQPISGPPSPGMMRAPTYQHPASGPPSPGMTRSQTYNPVSSGPPSPAGPLRSPTSATPFIPTSSGPNPTSPLHAYPHQQQIWQPPASSQQGPAGYPFPASTQAPPSMGAFTQPGHGQGQGGFVPNRYPPQQSPRLQHQNQHQRPQDLTYHQFP